MHEALVWNISQGKLETIRAVIFLVEKKIREFRNKKWKTLNIHTEWGDDIQRALYAVEQIEFIQRDILPRKSQIQQMNPQELMSIVELYWIGCWGAILNILSDHQIQEILQTPPYQQILGEKGVEHLDILTAQRHWLESWLTHCYFKRQIEAPSVLEKKPKSGLKLL
jgi:hypothetical protein